MLFIIVICHFMLLAFSKSVIKIPGRESITVGINAPSLPTTAEATAGAPTDAPPGDATPACIPPGAAPPAASPPASATPAASTPGAASPATATPGAASPGAASPGAASPSTATPGTATPAASPSAGPTVTGATTTLTTPIACIPSKTNFSQLSRVESPIIETPKPLIITLKKYSPEPPSNKTCLWQVGLHEYNPNDKFKRNINYYGNKIEQDSSMNVFQNSGFRYVSCKPYCIYDYPSGFKRNFNKLMMKRKRKRSNNFKMQIDHPVINKEKMQESHYIADDWRNRNTKIVDNQPVMKEVLSQTEHFKVVSSSLEGFSDVCASSVSNIVNKPKCGQNISPFIVLNGPEVVSFDINNKSLQMMATSTSDNLKVPSTKKYLEPQQQTVVASTIYPDYVATTLIKYSEEIKIDNITYPQIEQLPPSYITLLDFPNVFRSDLNTERFLELKFNEHKNLSNSSERSTKTSLLSEYITIKSKLDLGELQIIGRRKPTSNQDVVLIDNETTANKILLTSELPLQLLASEAETYIDPESYSEPCVDMHTHVESSTATTEEDRATTEGRSLPSTKGKYGGELEVRFRNTTAENIATT